MKFAEDTVVKFPVKTKLICSICAAPGQGSCRCGASYINPAEQKELRKALSRKLYTDDGLTQQEIAEKLGVSQDTIKRDLAGLTTIVKPPRPKGGRPKGSVAPKRKTATKEKMKAAVEARQRGKTQTEAAEESGLGSVQGVKNAEAYEEGWADALESIDVDPDTLAPSAKSKVEASKRMMERELKAEHAARMRAVDEEVRQRVLKETKEYLAMLKEREQEADKTIANYQEFTNNHKPLFNIDQFNLLRKCLHQRGIAASSHDFDAAFNLIQTKKLQLTGQK